MTAVAAVADNSALRKTAFSPEDDLGPSPLHPARVQRLRHHLHHREHMFTHSRTYHEQSEGQHARTHDRLKFEINPFACFTSPYRTLKDGHQRGRRGVKQERVGPTLRKGCVADGLGGGGDGSSRPEAR